MFSFLLWSAILGALTLAQFYPVLITRELTGFLDNQVHYTSFHLFFNSVFQGQLPLWSPAMNSGSPIWPSVELHNVWDPIAWIVYSIGFSLNAPSFHTFQWFLTTWLVLIGVGICLLCRSLKLSPTATLTAGILSTSSFMAVLSFLQGNGFILSVRFLPWVLLAALHHWKKPTPARGILFGALLGMQFANYHAPLNFLAILLILGTIATIQRPVLARYSIRQLGWIVLGALPFVGGLLALAFELGSLYPLAREAAPVGNSGNLHFSFLAPLFMQFPQQDLTQLLFAQKTGIARDLIRRMGHEFFFFAGTLPVLLCLTNLFIKKKSHPYSRCVLFSTLLFAAAFLGASQLFSELGEGTFLGYRNWRFFHPYLLLSFSVLTAISLDQLLSCRPKKIVSSLGLSAIVLVGVLYSAYALRPSTFAQLIPASDVQLCKPIIWVGSSLVLVLCAQRFVPKQNFGYAIVSILLLELVVFNLSWLRGSLPKLTAEVRAREPQLGVTLSHSNKPRLESFPISRFVPYHKEGAAIWNVPVFRTHPEPDGSETHRRHFRSIRFFYPAASYWFHPYHYQTLLSSRITSPVKNHFAGVGWDSPWRLFQCSAPYADALRGFRKDTLYVDSHTHKQYLATLNATSESCDWGSAIGTINVVKEGGDSFQLKIKSNQPALLYFANNHSPHWQATVNGKRVPFHRTNLSFSSISIGKGVSEVKLRYRPKFYLVSWWIRAVVFLLLTVAALATSTRAAFGAFAFLRDRWSCVFSFAKPYSRPGPEPIRPRP